MGMSTVLSSPLLAAVSVAVFAGLIPAGLSVVLVNVVNLYVIIIVIWAILSWFKERGGFVKEIYQILDKIVGPYVKLFRKIIPLAGGMDFSPLIAIILLQVLIRVLVGL